jgi:hypothetical protein
MRDSSDNHWSRRDFVHGAMSSAVLTAAPAVVMAAGTRADKSIVLAQIPKQRADNLKRLQDWIGLPSIAAENRNYPQGAEYMAKLAQDAGFSQAHSNVRQTGCIRTPRCRRQDHTRRLLHV